MVVGQTATASLSVNNSGSNSLQISQIQFSSANFSLSGNLTFPLTLAVGQNLTLTLEFAPSATGAASGTATLNSTGNPSSVTVGLSGTGVVPSPGIQLQSTSVNFGDVKLNNLATQADIITSSGAAPLTITDASVTGSGFSVSGITFPITLDPQATATLNITFDPTVLGGLTGQVSLATNTPSGSVSITLDGSAVSETYAVNLTWNAPTESYDPVAGYQIYRAVNNSGNYALLTTTASTAYTDGTVQNGDNYSYYVRSVDAEGNESAPSNIYTATIPN